jgi:hypothetical protein
MSCIVGELIIFKLFFDMKFIYLMILKICTLFDQLNISFHSFVIAMVEAGCQFEASLLSLGELAELAS